jgi:hypothetical protein
MGNEDLPNIYSMTAAVSMKKGKRTINREVWIISRYDTPADIMSKDHKSMDRIKTELYGKTHKGDKFIIIREIRTKKVVGKVNRSAV